METNGPTYTIAAANANNAGTYTVVVFNPSGTVTSRPATLAVGNTAPTFGAISGQTVNVGATVNVNDIATDTGCARANADLQPVERPVRCVAWLCHRHIHLASDGQRGQHHQPHPGRGHRTTAHPI